jgi:excisionase family DNA binding protein
LPAFSEQKLFDLCTIVERTGVSARTWRRLISAGKIGVLRIEGSVRIPEAELERFLAERFVPARPLRRPLAPASIEQLIEKHAPRRRGRPRAEAAG